MACLDRQRLLMRLLLVVVGSIGAGCSRFAAPQVTLVEAKLNEQTDVAIQLGVTVEVTNPNDEPVQLLEFDYRYAVNGAVVFDGRRSARQTLNPGSPRRIELPVVVRYDRAGWPDGQLPGSFQYQMRGTILYLTPSELAETLLDTGLRRPVAPFQSKGEVQLGATVEGR